MAADLNGITLRRVELALCDGSADRAHEAIDDWNAERLAETAAPLLDRPLSALGLAGSHLDRLAMIRILTIGDLVSFSAADFHRLRGLGAECRRAVCKSLAAHDLAFADEPPLTK